MSQAGLIWLWQGAAAVSLPPGKQTPSFVNLRAQVPASFSNLFNINLFPALPTGVFSQSFSAPIKPFIGSVSVNILLSTLLPLPDGKQSLPSSLPRPVVNVSFNPPNLLLETLASPIGRQSAPFTAIPPQGQPSYSAPNLLLDTLADPVGRFSASALPSAQPYISAVYAPNLLATSLQPLPPGQQSYSNLPPPAQNYSPWLQSNGTIVLPAPVAADLPFNTYFWPVRQEVRSHISKLPPNLLLSTLAPIDPAILYANKSQRDPFNPIKVARQGPNFTAPWRAGRIAVRKDT